MIGVRLIEFPKILDDRGNLSFFESANQIPFSIARTYWIYDVPGGEVRGGHAFKNQEEVIVALSGSFDIFVNDGASEKIFSLNKSNFGLYIPKMHWREIQNFSTNSLALIVVNSEYDQTEYIHDATEFRNYLKNGLI